MKDAFVDKKKRAAVMRKFRNLTPEIQKDAIKNVPSDMRAPFEKTIAKSKYCQGRLDTKCDFAATARGGRVQLKEGLYCFLCGPSEDLVAYLKTDAGLRRMRCDLSKMSPGRRAEALKRIPQEWHEALNAPKKKVHMIPLIQIICVFKMAFICLNRAGVRGEVTRLTGRKRRRDSVKITTAYTDDELRKRNEEGQQAWNVVLNSRRTNLRRPTVGMDKQYRKRKLDDRAKARRRFEIKFRTSPHADIDNDTGLPPAKRARLASDLQHYAKYNSWGQCENCGIMIPRDMTPDALTTTLSATVLSGLTLMLLFNKLKFRNSGQDNRALWALSPFKQRGFCFGSFLI